MTNDRITELAMKSDFWQPHGLPSNWNDGDFVVTKDELQRFAALVRDEALDEAMQVLEFHGFDDAVPYVKWAAVNGRSMK